MTKKYILVGPSYDNLTEVMRKWLETLFEKLMTGASLPGGSLITGENATQEILRSQLAKGTSREEVTLIFYGHGDDIGLLTSPTKGPALPDGEHGRLVTQEDFHVGEMSVVVGFCCSSALIFGRDLYASRKAGAFIGYKKTIDFVLDRPYCNAFERPMSKFVLEDGWSIERLRRCYMEEYNKWLGGEFSDGPAADIVCMCLDQHVRSLQGYQD